MQMQFIVTIDTGRLTNTLTDDSKGSKAVEAWQVADAVIEFLEADIDSTLSVDNDDDNFEFDMTVKDVTVIDDQDSHLINASSSIGVADVHGHIMVAVPQVDA